MTRPQWLPPTWVMLRGTDMVKRGEPGPIYVRASDIMVVLPNDGGSTVVLTGDRSALQVDDTPQEVFQLVSGATRGP